MNQPLAHLALQIAHRFGVALERRNLHVHQSLCIGVQLVGHYLEPLQGLLQRAFVVLGSALPLLRVLDEEGANLREGNVRRDGELAGELDELEGEVGRPDAEACDEGVDDGEEAREGGPRDGVDLEDAEGDEDEPAVELAKVHVAQQAENVDGGRGDGIVRQHAGEDAAGDEVADGDALLPGDDVRAEALVCESARGVEEGIARELEVDEACRGAGAVVAAGAARLVRVVQSGEAAEARLDVAVGRAGSEPQVGVEVGGEAQLVVGLVDGVGEVCGDDEDVDDAPVGGVAGGAGRGLGVAGADGEAVVDGLDPRRGELCAAFWLDAYMSLSCVLEVGGGADAMRVRGREEPRRTCATHDEDQSGREERLTPGRKDQPTMDRNCDIVAGGASAASDDGGKGRWEAGGLMEVLASGGGCLLGRGQRTSCRSAIRYG